MGITELRCAIHCLLKRVPGPGGRERGSSSPTVNLLPPQGTVDPFCLFFKLSPCSDEIFWGRLRGHKSRGSKNGGVETREALGRNKGSKRWTDEFTASHKLTKGFPSQWPKGLRMLRANRIYTRAKSLQLLLSPGWNSSFLLKIHGQSFVSHGLID